jgi:hypothetical protein
MSLLQNDVPLYSTIDPRIYTSKETEYVVGHVAKNVDYRRETVSSYSSSNINQSLDIASGTVLDRVVFIETEWRVNFTGKIHNGTAGILNLRLVNIEKDNAPRFMPLSSSTSNLVVNVEGQAFSVRLQEIVNELVRCAPLTYKTNLLTGAPSMQDFYQEYVDYVSQGAARSPLATVGSNSYQLSRASINIDQTGNPLIAVPAMSDNTYSAYVVFRSYEPVMCGVLGEPRADQYKGLYLPNGQLTIQYSLSDPKNTVWSLSAGPAAAAVPTENTTYDLTVSSATLNAPPVVHYTVLSMNNVALPLYPPGSNAINWSYMNYQTLFNSPDIALAAGASSVITTPVIKPNSISDVIMVWCKRRRNDMNALTSDVYARINSISMSFNNRSGLLSNATDFDLWKISVKNGLSLSYQEWYRYTGSLLLLRPEDFGLAEDEAAGTLLASTLQLQVNFTNISAAAVNYNVWVCAASSDILTLMAGAYVSTTGFLSKDQVVASASLPMNEQPSQQEENMRGGGIFSSLRKAAKAVGNVAKQGANLAWQNRGTLADLAADAGVPGAAQAQMVARMTGQGLRGGSPLGGAAVGGAPLGGYVMMAPVVKRGRGRPRNPSGGSTQKATKQTGGGASVYSHQDAMSQLKKYLSVH